jgi:hypothetical protein
MTTPLLVCEASQHPAWRLASQGYSRQSAEIISRPRAGQDALGFLICLTIVLSVRNLSGWHEGDQRSLGDYDWLAEQWLA